MSKINLDKLMNSEAGKRTKNLHVQISPRSKQFLKKEAERNGIVMGLYLEKLLSLLRESLGEKT